MTATVTLGDTTAAAAELARLDRSIVATGRSIRTATGVRVELTVRVVRTGHDLTRHNHLMLEVALAKSTGASVRVVTL